MRHATGHLETQGAFLSELLSTCHLSAQILLCIENVLFLCVFYNQYKQKNDKCNIQRTCYVMMHRLIRTPTLHPMPQKLPTLLWQFLFMENSFQGNYFIHPFSSNLYVCWMTYTLLIHQTTMVVLWSSVLVL